MITNNKETIIEQIETDLKAIGEAVSTTRSYRDESIEDIQKRIIHNTKQLEEFTKTSVEVGNWIQAFTGGKEPFYAKVKSIKDFYVILEGIYNFDDQGNRTPNAFPIEWLIPVSYELGKMLEYANGNNKQLTVNPGDFYVKRN